MLGEDLLAQMRYGVATAMREPTFRAQWESNIRVPGTKFAVFVDEVIAALRPEHAAVGDNIRT